MTFLDERSNNVFALKEFDRFEYFSREEAVYRHMQSHASTQHFVNTMLESDAKNTRIKLQMGSCTLFEMYQLMHKNPAASRWNED